MEIKLGENIKHLRKKAAMTQEQLAEALGVTTGAVYKWESGKATPELPMLVDIAAFFETSVDALLDYGWEKLSMAQAVEKLRRFCVTKELDAGMRCAEQMLQKFPNSYDITLRCAEVYFLTMKPEHMPRALELYEKAISLVQQKESPEVHILTLQNRIASCYCYMDRMDEAVDLLKKNNLSGMNNARIGLLLSQDSEKADDALGFLSDALSNCYSELYNLCIGYANAYGAKEELDKVYDLTLWLYQLGNGLREPRIINWMDRGNVRLFTILAEVEYLRGKEATARDWLLRAKEAAEKFDAAPNYHTGAGLKFYHGSENATSYDDMGDTAMDMIARYMSDDVVGKNLRPIWKEISPHQ